MWQEGAPACLLEHATGCGVRPRRPRQGGAARLARSSPAAPLLLAWRRAALQTHRQAAPSINKKACFRCHTCSASERTATVLSSTAYAPATKRTRALLAEGMQVNARGPRGATPLHIAARLGQISMVDLLLNPAPAPAPPGRSRRHRRQGAPSCVGLSSITRAASVDGHAVRRRREGSRPAHRTAPGIDTPAALASASQGARSSLTADERCRRLLEAAFLATRTRLPRCSRSEPVRASTSRAHAARPRWMSPRGTAGPTRYNCY